MPPLISSPLRLLLLSTPETLQPVCLKDIYHHEIRTPYYNASIPIWRDTLPPTPPTIKTWKEEWTSSEASEVIHAVGAWVVCFKKPRDKADLQAICNLLNTIHEVIHHHANPSLASEPLMLAVGMPQSISPSLEMGSEEWEDLCRGCGAWEWIDGEVDGATSEQDGGKMHVERNEFGEKTGVPRLLEALEANEWDPGDRDADGLEAQLGFGKDDGFAAEAAQMEREMMGLKMAVHGEEDEEEGGDGGVEELEDMVLRMQAIKDMGADMAGAERRKFAARAVRDVMKTF